MIKKLTLILSLVLAALVIISIFLPQKISFLISSKPEPEKEIKILLVGDIMMDRSIRTRAENLGYDFYFSCVAEDFAKYDFVIANLESTATNYPSVSQGKPQEDYDHFRFTVDSKALIAMKKAGIDVVGLDNNHIFDFGHEGVAITKQNLAVAGLKYFGDPTDKDNSNLRLEKDGVAFHLVSFNEFFGSSAQTIKNINKAEININEVVTENEVSSDEPVIVFAHWGDEYVETATRVKQWARQFVEAGADAVIGMHPHVVQGSETYQNKFIAYSLGNFIFDQYFSEEVKKGAAAELTLTKTGITNSRILPVSLDAERRPCLSE